MKKLKTLTPLNVPINVKTSSKILSRSSSKYFLLATLALMLSLAQKSQATIDNCPTDWPIAMTEADFGQAIAIKAHPDLIQNNQRSGNKYFDFASAYNPQVKTAGTIVVGHFVDPKSNGGGQWIDIGRLEKTDRVSVKTACSKLAIYPEVHFAEVTKKEKVDCLFFPAWVCGKKTVSKLQLQVTKAGKTYTMESISGLTVE